MKKLILLRSINGFFIGIAIGNILSIIFSLIFANGYYSLSLPQFVDKVGTQINAVVIQTVLHGIIGAVFSGASTIWECEKWGLLKQTISYFTICFTVMMPIAYYLEWFNDDLKTIVIFIAMFIFIFLIIWIVIFIYIGIKIKKINKKIKLNKKFKNT